MTEPDKDKVHSSGEERRSREPIRKPNRRGNKQSRERNQERNQSSRERNQERSQSSGNRKGKFNQENSGKHFVGPPLPRMITFNGKQEWKPFIMHFERMVKCYEWLEDEKLDMLVSCLRDKVLSYYTAMIWQKQVFARFIKTEFSA